MWELEHTHRTTAAPDRVWEWYLDHASAPDWDPLVARISPDGPMVVGGTGRNTPRTGPSVPFRYTEVTPGVSYTEVSRLPGARMAFTHLLTPDGSGTTISHGMRCEGPLTPVYRLLLGRSYRSGMPAALAALARSAEQGPPPGAARP